jgi:peptide/nickel transport system substrate-binding protein
LRTSNRRITIAAVLGIIAMIVAACGSNSTPGGSAPPTNGYNFDYTYTAPGSGQNTGTITFGEYEQVDTLNPFLAGIEIDAESINLLLDGCIAQLPNLKSYVPDQCTEVPSVANGDESSDFMSTTFKIDPNAVWSDGQPITSDDFLFYYDMYVDPNFFGGAALPPYSEVQSVTAVDPHTVKIQWKKAFGPFLAALWPPFPAHDFPAAYNLTTHKYTTPSNAVIGSEKFNFTYDGNGPYKLQSHSPNSEVYIPNPKFHSNYFHGPNAGKIIFKSEGSVPSTIAAFKAGNLDQASDFVVTTIPQFSGLGIPSSEQVFSPADSYEHFDFNLRPQAPNAKDKSNTSHASIFSGTNGQLVRKAFVESFNLCGAFIAILNTSNCNDPTLYTAENAAPPDQGYDPSVKLPAYNPSQGQQDLKTAGFANCQYPDGTPITVNIDTTSGNPTRAAFVQLAATEWKNSLGCNVTVNEQPASQLFGSFSNGGTLESGTFDIALFAYIDGGECSLNDLTFLSSEIPNTSNPLGGNVNGINDPTIDSDINTMLGEPDTAKRYAECKSFQQYYTQQIYNMPLYIRANIDLVDSALQNFKENPTSVGFTWNVADWWTTAAA